MLLVSGFDRSNLSLLAIGKAVDDKLGHYDEPAAEQQDDPHVRSWFRPAASPEPRPSGLHGSTGGALGTVLEPTLSTRHATSLDRRLQRVELLR